MNLLKQALPHLIAVLLLAGLAIGVFAPTVLDNKALPQHDNFQAYGMQGEIRPFQEKEGRVPLWTNQVFVGMPTFQLVTPVQMNLIDQIGYRVLRLGKPVDSPSTMLWLMMLMTYIALLVLKIDWRIALLGGLSFGLMTSNIIYIEAGHSVKMYALAFVPPLLAGMIAAYRGQWLLGTGIYTFFLALNLAGNHIQITYYAFFVLGLIALGYFVDSLRQGRLGYFLKCSAALAVGTALAGGTAVSMILPSLEYSKESTRGQTELKNKENKDGLDRDYALGLSLEKKEALTLMLPYFYGGGQGQEDALTGGKGKKNTELDKMLKKVSSNPQLSERLRQADQDALGRALSAYWGSQTMTGAPLYFGVVLCMLFFLGLVLVRGTLKWVLALGMGLLVVLAWGKFFPLTDFLFDRFPLYNKFRDVKMTLLLGQGIVVMLGALALKELLHFDLKKHESSTSAKLLRALKLPVAPSGFVLLGAGITALLALFGLLYSFVGTPSTPYDAAVIDQVPELIEAAQSDRRSIMRSDALTALGFIALAGALLWWFARQQEKRLAATAQGDDEQGAGFGAWLLLGGLFVFIAVDLTRIDFHYLNKDSFKKREDARRVPKTDEDDFIAKMDEGKPAHEKHYRVLDYRFGMPSQNAYGGYKHKIVGGYHAAKPILFQELIEKYPDMDRNPQAFFSQRAHIAEMLNTRYVLTGQGAPIPLNPCGNAWFVGQVQWVDDADAELEAIGSLEPRQKAVIQSRFKDALGNLPAEIDSAATARLTDYHPEKMTYEVNSATGGLVVFSEMYYPPAKGWEVSIDGQPVAGGFVKANYLLRALPVPAGKHTVEMRFDPRSFRTGETIALISSLGVLALLGLGLWSAWKAGQTPTPPLQDDQDQTAA